MQGKSFVAFTLTKETIICLKAALFKEEEDFPQNPLCLSEMSEHGKEWAIAIQCHLHLNCYSSETSAQ